MSKETILNNEYATLWFYPETGILHHKIHKFMPARRFQELLTTGAELLEKHNASKWLSDDGANTVVSTKAVDWGTRVWTPRVVRAGFRYWAIVMPAGVIGKMQMKTLIEDQRALGIAVKTFQTEQDALRWLEAVDKAGRK